jgi:hypothetical protein
MYTATHVVRLCDIPRLSALMHAVLMRYLGVVHVLGRVRQPDSPLLLLAKQLLLEQDRRLQARVVVLPGERDRLVEVEPDESVANLETSHDLILHQAEQFRSR